MSLLSRFSIKHTSKIRWAVVGVVVITGLTVAMLMGDLAGYLLSWAGTAFKALSGGLIGWAVSRYVVQLDLSEVTKEQRPLAALSQAILIAGFAFALATGA
jgi:uncharacterized membrane protein YgaE (UPF0421/DUF939 family)